MRSAQGAAHYGNGQKDFTISSAFQLTTKFFPGDLDCWIKFTLTLKGTDTDASSDYPEISIVDGSTDGLPKVRLNYSA